MQKKLTILSHDPSLSNWGVALMNYSPNFLSAEWVDVLTTSKEPSKYKAEDDLRRLKTIANKLKDIRVDIHIAEIPMGSQSARAMTSYGAVLGILATLNPLLTVTPYQVKKVLGEVYTDKKKIVEWVRQKHPNVLYPHFNKANHEADAIVAAYAAQNQIKEYYENHIHSI